MKGAPHYQTLELARIRALFRGFTAASKQSLRVLDYGCGHGKYLRELALLGCDVTGADFNEAYVEEARSAGFEAPDLVTLFASKREFDIVLLSHLIEHLSPEEVSRLIPRLCRLIRPGGRLVVVTPILNERFYHDATHIRPYYPQSIRHAFGQTTSEVSFGASAILTLEDIYFFKDPFRTRLWRSFYVGSGVKSLFTGVLNRLFEFAWRISYGRIGASASWLGVYNVAASDESSTKRSRPQR